MTDESRARCLNCSWRLAVRPRGLCTACYDEDAIRERFPVTSKYAPHRGYWAEGRGLPMPPNTPPTPTTAPPGSEAKIVELQRRCERGEALHADGDVRLDVDRAGWRTMREECA